MNNFAWKVTVGKTYLGIAAIEPDERFDLIQRSVDAGVIPADYKITDVVFEMVKNESAY